MDGKEMQVLKSSRDLSLAGLAWSFGIEGGATGNHSIQPLYLSKADTNHVIVQHELYPPLCWAHSPPSEVLLRPVPAVPANLYPYTSSLSSSDDLDMFSDFRISSIRVYFNAFLQGITFCYSTRTNKYVASEIRWASKELSSLTRNEYSRYGCVNVQRNSVRRACPGISSVLKVYERVSLLLGAFVLLICLPEFGLVKWTNSQPVTRFSPYFGWVENPFGPFMHRQSGLWDLAWGVCADYHTQTTKTYLEPETSFTGLHVL